MVINLENVSKSNREWFRKSKKRSTIKNRLSERRLYNLILSPMFLNICLLVGMCDFGLFRPKQ